MSQASEMVAEVKGLVADIEKDVKSFEKQVEGVGAPGGPDVIQLGKMLIHGRVFQTDLRNRRGNVEDAQLAEMEAQEAAEVEPGPEPAAVVAPEPAQEPAVAPAVDPAADLVAQPEPTPETA